MVSSESGDLADAIYMVLGSSQWASICALSIDDDGVIELLKDQSFAAMAEYPSKIPVKLDTTPYLFHAKILVTPGYAVIGSMNFTRSSLHEDLNDAIVFDEPESIATLMAAYNALWKREGPGIFKTSLGNFYISPFVDLESVIMETLSKAKREVKIAVYAFTDRNVLGALKYLHSLGIDIKLALDDWNEDHILKEPLDQFKVKVFGDTTLHHKFIIVDGKWLITGSANLTESGLHRNFEIIFLTSNPRIVESYEKIFEKIWSRR